MALHGTAIAVFVIPIVFSFVYGASVLSLALSDQSSNGLIPSESPSSSISIIGLKDDYAASDRITAQVSVSDSAYDCGDLYLTVYDISSFEKKPVGQHAFFDQCYGASGTIPLNEEFSEKIDKAGKYSLVVQLFDKDGSKFLTAEKQLTVK